MKKLLTFFLTALLAFSVGWAETTTVTASKVTSSSATWTGSGGETWNVSVNGGATNQNMVNNYAQIGTRTSPSTSVTFSTSISGTITSIVVDCASYNGLATLSATVGGSSFGTQSQSTPSWSNNSGGDVTFTGSATGGIVITMTNGSSGRAMYIKSITVTYSSGSTPVEENWYRKVTSTSDLSAGKKYIIVNEANSTGMGALNDNRYGTGITGLSIDNDRVNIGGTDVMEMILGGSSNAWTFRMGENGNYLSNSSSNNNTFFSASSVASSSTDITKWTITPGSSSCSICSNYVTSQYIRFNSSGQFGTYVVTAQSPVALYVEDDGSTPVETCATPTFSPAAGTYTSAQSVTISTTTSGASIRYTTDGSTPTSTSGTVYTGAINVSETTTIKAIAYKDGNNDSQVAEATYTINSGSSSGSKIYRKVTSTDDLVPGQNYIIMYENGSSSVGMGAYDGSKHFSGVTNLTVSNNKVDIANTSVLELTLGGSAGAWTLYTGNGFIQGADGVQFNVVSDGTANNSKWIITNTVSGTNGYVAQNLPVILSATMVVLSDITLAAMVIGLISMCKTIALIRHWRLHLIPRRSVTQLLHS